VNKLAFFFGEKKAISWGGSLRGEMHTNLVGVMVAFAIVVVLLSCKAANRPPKPHELEIHPHQIQHQPPSAKTNPKQTIPIHLSLGSFDPLLEESPAFISTESLIQSYEERR
jgi:hypothetical protein